MARYTGPKTKISRKFGEPLFGEDRTLEKKNYPPGQHGNSKRRAKKSEYAIQLMEKQKAKYTYGILEKQFKNIYDKANRGKGITVNGSIVNIPSYTLRPGDIVSVREKSKSLKAIESSLIENNSEYEWIKFNRERLEGEFVSVPEREQIPENIKEQLIVELYSK